MTKFEKRRVVLRALMPVVTDMPVHRLHREGETEKHAQELMRTYDESLKEAHA